MATGTRRRIEPASNPGVTHNIGTIAKGTEDIERVALDTDRVGFNTANRVFDQQSDPGGGGPVDSSTFINCTGYSKVWIAVEYADGVNVNDLCLMFKDFESTPNIRYGRIFVPANLGISANVIQSAYNQAALMEAECFGFQFVGLRINTWRVACSAWLCPV